MTEIICDRCQCDDVRRIRRRGAIERWFFPLLSIYPFLCGRCGHRFLSVVPRDVADEIPDYPAVRELAS